jgi:SAM-dependent MidA family methyltransferase
VDCASLAAVARVAGATAHGPLSQAAFLGALGIQRRAARLGAAATQAQARAIQSQVERLTGADQMGSLFQAMAITHPDLPTPPGFEP